MSNDNLLPDLDHSELISSWAKAQLDEATARYFNAAAGAHSALDDIAAKAASRCHKPVDARNEAANLFERFAQGVSMNTDRILETIAAPSPPTGADQAHVEALELRVSELTAGQDALRDEAYRASSLQVDLDQAKAAEAATEAENSRLQRELATAKTKAAATEAENSRLRRELATAKTKAAATEAENSRLRPPTAAPLGQPGERLTTAAKPPPNPQKGWRDRSKDLFGTRRRGSRGGEK